MYITGVGLVWHGGTEESVEMVDGKVTSFHVSGVGITKEQENNMSGRQTKTIQWTINLPMDFPSDWDDDMIEFHIRGVK